MKHRFTLLLCLFSALGLWAQQKEVEAKIKNYSAKIDSIVAAEKFKMNQEMDAVDLKFKEEKISNEEKMLQKKTIAEKYEKIINEKVDQKNTELQSITKEIAANSVFNKRNDTVNVVLLNRAIFQGELKTQKGKVIIINKDKKDHPKNHLRNKELAISYGFLNLSADAESFDPFDANSKMRVGNSHSFEIQSRRERQFGSFTSPFFIRYGLAYRSDTYMPKRPLVFVQNNQTLALEEFSLGTLKRSKLRNVYLTLPVDFQWVLNPKYTEYEGVKYLDNKKKQIRIGAGIYAGVNLRNIIKVKYYDHEGDFEKYKNTLDYGVNSFLFGTKFSVSYNGINFFIKKDLTPIFNNQAALPNKYGIQIGVDIMDLNF